jgi:hypothetical protein
VSCFGATNHFGCAERVGEHRIERQEQQQRGGLRYRLAAIQLQGAAALHCGGARFVADEVVLFLLLHVDARARRGESRCARADRVAQTQQNRSIGAAAGGREIFEAHVAEWVGVATL